MLEKARSGKPIGPLKSLMKGKHDVRRTDGKLKGQETAFLPYGDHPHPPPSPHTSRQPHQNHCSIEGFFNTHVSPSCRTYNRNIITLWQYLKERSRPSPKYHDIGDTSSNIVLTCNVFSNRILVTVEE